MTIIQQLLIKDWGPKLVCLILATTLWYLINQNVEKNPRPERVLPSLTAKPKTP